MTNPDLNSHLLEKKFSFVIPTYAESPTLKRCIDSIVHNVPEQCREIIVVGCDSDHPAVSKSIPFNDYLRGKPWITRKKNLGVAAATHDVVCVMHDYIELQTGWYLAWSTWNAKYDVAVNRIVTPSGARHSDWVVCPFDLWEVVPELHGDWSLSLPYRLKGLTKVQYISGNYYVGRKEFLMQHPLNEDLTWGDAEDVEWSRRIRQHTEFKINMLTSVTLMKEGKWEPPLMAPIHIQQLVQYHNLEVWYEG